MTRLFATTVLLGCLVCFAGCPQPKAGPEKATADFEYLMVYRYETGGGFDKQVAHFIISGPKTYIEASSWEDLATQFGVQKEKGHIVAIMNKLGRDGWELVSVSEASQPTISGAIHHVAGRWTFKRSR